MAKKNGKISISKLESLVNKNNTIVVPMNGTGDTEIVITYTIPLIEMLSFVESVADSCVDIDSGEYYPQLFDFSLRKEVLTRYANFTMPSNVERQYEIVYKTEAFDQVMEYIDKVQFNLIVDSARQKVKFMLDCITSIATANTNNLLSRFEALASQSEDMFNSVGNEDGINTLMSQLDKISQYDEGKLARAVNSLKENDDTDSGHDEETEDTIVVPIKKAKESDSNE